MIQLSFWVWLGLLVALLILEAVTVQLVAVWFMGGALAAMLGSLCGLNLFWQLILFVVFSGLSLVLLRPLLAARLKTHKVPTNADMVIGKAAVVIQTIDNDRSTGRVQVSGLGWAARSYDNSVIQPGAKVGVCAIDGVKLIVVPIKED